MTPLADNILIEQVEVDTNPSSMILTTSKEQRTRVVAVGKDVKLVKPGDFIVAGQTINTGEHTFVKESNVIAIIKGE